jgi:hypothetical protein
MFHAAHALPQVPVMREPHDAGQVVDSILRSSARSLSVDQKMRGVVMERLHPLDFDSGWRTCEAKHRHQSFVRSVHEYGVGMRLGARCHRDKSVPLHKLNVDLGLAVGHPANCGKVSDRARLVGDIQA